MYRYIIIFVLLFFSITGQAYAQTGLPVNWDKAVVVIEKFVTDSLGTYTSVHGTGFFVQDDSPKPVPFLVTNKHILAGRDSVLIRFYDKENLTEKVVHLKDRKGNIAWKGHPHRDVDVAALLLEVNATVVALEFFRFKFIKDIGVGEDVFFFGFPLGLMSLIGPEGNPILRHGVVSYKTSGITFVGSDSIPGSVLLIDGFSFGGNSGSPVVTKITGNMKASLAGIVYGHVPYFQNIVFGNKRSPVDSLTVSVNTGLVKAFPAERIKETIELFKVR